MNTMLRSTLALVRNDFRAIAGFTGLMLAVNLMCVFFQLYPAVTLGFANLPKFYPAHPLYGSISHWLASFSHYGVFMMAALFAVAFNVQWKSTARSQILFQPKRRYSHLLLMMLVTWAAGSIVCSIPEFGIYAYYLTIKSQLYQGNILTPRYSHYLDTYIFVIPREIFLLTGMVCFAQGIMTAIRRYKLAVWTLAFITAIAVFSFVSSRFIHPSAHTWIEQFQSPIGWEMGAIFLLVGLFLFDRYAEA
jgi:hypothetical protein